MKTWKTAVAAVLAVVFVLGLFGCASSPAQDEDNTTPSQEQVQGVQMKVAALKGPTGIGMVKLMEDNEAGGTVNQYTFQIASAPDEIVAAVSSGEVQVAAVPVNLASTLYNKTSGKVQVAAVNTLGVLYVLENGSAIQSVADLKGKTIYASGQGATPEYVLNYILSSNGIDPKKDVTIVYKADHAELATLMAAGKADICLLPEPNVTTVLAQNKNVRIALDMTKEWDSASRKNGKSGDLSMGCIIVNKAFAEQNKAAFNQFMEEYKASVAYVTNEANLDTAAKMTQARGIIPKAEVAKQAIPKCNIVFIEGEAMKTNMQANLQILFEANPKSVGGAMPDDNFYYTR